MREAPSALPPAEAPLIEALDGSAHFIGALDEFASIAATIARTRAEIARLAPAQIKSERLCGAGEQLGAVSRDTEAATHTIMSAAESILAAAPSAQIAEQIVKIFEACAFQDLTGQRVRRVAEALAEIDQRLARFADAMGIAAAAGRPAAPGVSQSDVDLILGAR
jgi:hypothetical protein